MAKVPPDAVGERAREGELGSDGASLSGDGSNKPAFDSRVETGEIFGSGVFLAFIIFLIPSPSTIHVSHRRARALVCTLLPLSHIIVHYLKNRRHLHCAQPRKHRSHSRKRVVVHRPRLT